MQGHSDSVASIEFLEEREAGNIVIVPLVTRTTADGDISVTISNGSISSISNTTHLFGVTASSSTRTYVADPQEARSEFNLDSLVIKELRLASIRNGRVQISAPDGFNFESIGGSLDSAIINVDPGLSWGDGMTGSTPIGGDYADLSYRVDSDGKVDYSTIELTLKDIKTSSRTPGAVYITGLRLVADDDAPFGEIYLRTKNLSYKGKVEKIVSEENHILAGTRVDWKVSLYTEGELPELINGRYEGSQSNADDENHKTAHVIFEENAANAWWAGRETIFTLPKGVKFRKVEITDTENIADGSSLERIFLNDGKINGKVTVDGNVLKLNGISIEKESNPPYDLKKARLEMDIWVSIESGFEGDIALSLDGSSVSGAEIPTDIVIATQITPITVLTTTSDVKIGYQYYQTGDFEIKEVMPGALLKNRQVRISVSDRISQDMFFTPDFTCEVLESNIKISKPTISYGGSANTNLGDDVGKSSMFFNIERSSTDTGATIKFSNVFVKIDRSVPETSTPYELIVWGSAIANNYNNTSDAELDNFATPGIKVPYVSVVTAASDKQDCLHKQSA